MKAWHMAAALLLSILLLQALVLGLYLLVKDRNTYYELEYIVKVDWTNETYPGGPYNLTVPGPVLIEDGSPVVNGPEGLDIVLGRAAIEPVDDDNITGFRITSDTPLLLVHTLKLSGRDLRVKKAILSTQAGDIGIGSASIKLFSERSGLKVEVHLYQDLERSGNRHDMDLYTCSSTVNKGWSSYPLKEVTSKERLDLKEFDRT